MEKKKKMKLEKNLISTINFMFNNTMVKADIFWVTENTKIYWEAKTTYEKMNYKNYLYVEGCPGYKEDDHHCNWNSS